MENYGNTTTTMPGFLVLKPTFISQMKGGQQVWVPEAQGLNQKEVSGTETVLSTSSYLLILYSFPGTEIGVEEKEKQEVPGLCLFQQSQTSPPVPSACQMLSPFQSGLPSHSSRRRVHAAVPPQQTISFEDVAVYFTEEEGALLDRRQRALYKEVMLDNYETVTTLGFVDLKPELIVQLEQGEEPWVESLDNTRTTCSAHDIMKKHRCPECGKCFICKSKLLVHQRAHTRKKPYKCLECGKSFSWRTGLVRHKIMHAAEKPYKCLVCGKSFFWKSDLANHERIHTEEKPHRCLECGKCFHWKSSLLSHHRRERIYKCLECKEYFALEGNLWMHKRNHPGEKCSKCLGV